MRLSDLKILRTNTGFSTEINAIRRAFDTAKFRAGSEGGYFHLWQYDDLESYQQQGSSAIKSLDSCLNVYIAGDDDRDIYYWTTSSVKYQLVNNAPAQILTLACLNSTRKLNVKLSVLTKLKYFFD
jgi:hypothetical protein